MIRAGEAGYDIYGGWQPTNLLELAECEADPYITPAGVLPEWVEQIRAAAAECRAGHPAGRPLGGRCGMFGCRGQLEVSCETPAPAPEV